MSIWKLGTIKFHWNAIKAGVRKELCQVPLYHIKICTNLANEATIELHRKCKPMLEMSFIKHARWLPAVAQFFSFAMSMWVSFSLANERCFTHPAMKLCLSQTKVWGGPQLCGTGNAKPATTRHREALKRIFAFLMCHFRVWKFWLYKTAGMAKASFHLHRGILKTAQVEVSELARGSCPALQHHCHNAAVPTAQDGTKLLHFICWSGAKSSSS